ncbi:hypothetical protein BJ546DRAFT_950492 [Cryomyces antarcticus]
MAPIQSTNYAPIAPSVALTAHLSPRYCVDRAQMCILTAVTPTVHHTIPTWHTISVFPYAIPGPISSMFFTSSSNTVLTSTTMSVNPIPTLPPGFVDIFNHEGEDPDPGGHFDHLSKKRTWYLLMGASAGVVFFSFLIMWLWIRLETFGRWMVTAAPHDGGPNHQRQYLKTWCGWLDVSSGRGKRKMARLQEGKARQERSRDDQELIYRNPNVVDLGDALQAMDIDRTIRPAWLGGSPKKSKEAKRHGPARSPKPRFDNKTSQSPGKHTTAPEKPRHPPPGEPPARSTSIEVPTNDVSNSSSHGRSKRFPVLHKQPAPRIVVSKFTIDNGTLRKRDVVRDRACMHGSDGSGDIVRATTTQFLRPPSTPNGSRARKITATMSLTLPRRHVPVADQRPFDNRSVSLPTRRMNPSIDSVGSQRTKGKKQRRMFRSNVTDTPSEDSDVVPSKRLLAGETDDTGGTVTPGGSTPPPGVLALHDKMRPLKIRARRASHACGDRSAEETTQPPSFVIPNSNLSPSHTPDSVIRIKSHELEDLETSNVQSSKPPSVLGMSSMISFVTGVSGRGKDVWNGASNILQEVGDSERANGAQLFKTQGTVSKGWHSLKPHKTFGSRSPNTPSCRSISSPAPAEAFWTNDTIRLKSFPHRFPLNVASLLGHHHDSSAKLNRSRRGSSTSTVRPKLMDGDPVSHSHFGIGLSRLGIRTGRHSPFSWTDRNSVGKFKHVDHRSCSRSRSTLASTTRPSITNITKPEA